jgi:hypothetical protein
VSAVDGIRVEVDVTSIGADERAVVVREGARELARVTAFADRATPLAFVLDAPPGYQRLSITVDGEPVRNTADRTVSVRYENLKVTSPGTARVVSLHDQARTRAVFP